MNYRDFTIVIPTFNEEENIGILINKLSKAYDSINVVVVDDGSTDATKSVVITMAKNNHNIKFVDRSKRNVKGLTASAVEGILKSKTQFAIVMDADLQHPIEPIEKIAERLRDGDKIVVATRAEAKGWQLHRKLISKTLIYVGYVLLVIRGKSVCGDIFSGFFGTGTEFFKETYTDNKSKFVGSGYKILYDLLKCTKRNTVRISEVPYSFGLRKHGASKASFKHGVLLLKSFIT